MIPKTFVSVIGLGIFALIAFASSETPDRNRIAAVRGAAPGLEVVQPSDDIVVRSGGEQLVASVPACADSIASCGDPVKHLGTQNDCACFACGYGTATQHSVCTKNPADKEALFKRAK